MERKRLQQFGAHTHTLNNRATAGTFETTCVAENHRAESSRQLDSPFVRDPNLRRLIRE